MINRGLLYGEGKTLSLASVKHGYWGLLKHTSGTYLWAQLLALQYLALDVEMAQREKPNQAEKK